VGGTNEKINRVVERFRGQELEAHYLAFFDCFNKGEYFEAHEVLEEIWLPRRNEANGRFFKGLIQLAGAFVHLQKGRLRPAGALLDLARDNLQHYSPRHERLDVKEVLSLINVWRGHLEDGDFAVNPLPLKVRPEICLG
jgi:predicted metal-dependent hydrolase